MERTIKNYASILSALTSFGMNVSIEQNLVASPTMRITVGETHFCLYVIMPRFEDHEALSYRSLAQEFEKTGHDDISPMEFQQLLEKHAAEIIKRHI